MLSLIGGQPGSEFRRGRALSRPLSSHGGLQRSFAQLGENDVSRRFDGIVDPAAHMAKKRSANGWFP